MPKRLHAACAIVERAVSACDAQRRALSETRSCAYPLDDAIDVVRKVLVAEGRISLEERALLTATKAYAVPSPAHSIWSIVSTLIVFAAAIAVVPTLGPGLSLLVLPLLTLLLVRIFVLQHDLGHRNLFRRRGANDVVGRVLSIFTSVAHDAWRVEHDWHHQVTGRMDRRGVDQFNSPMTLDEAIANPTRAEGFHKKVHFWNIGVLGMLALLVERRRPRGFFVYRDSFVWKFDERGVFGSVVFANVAWFAWNALLIAAWGPLLWVTTYAPAMVLAAMIGAWLFWVQHNFETAVLKPGEQWSFVEAAVDGSSYVRVPRSVRWFFADIGIHHVHHLNSHIPSYRLEEARRGIPRLAAVAPLTSSQLRTAFTHHFHDEAQGRRVPIAAVRAALGAATSKAPPSSSMDEAA